VATIEDASAPAVRHNRPSAQELAHVIHLPPAVLESCIRGAEKKARLQTLPRALFQHER